MIRVRDVRIRFCAFSCCDRRRCGRLSQESRGAGARAAAAAADRASCTTAASAEDAAADPPAPASSSACAD